MSDGPAELKKRAEKREKQRLATKKCREKQRLATKTQALPTQEDNSNQDPLNDAFRLLDKQELYCMGVKMYCMEVKMVATRYEMQNRKPNEIVDKQVTQIAGLNALVDEKGDFIKELADFIKELAAAKGDFVKAKEFVFVSSSPSPPAQESKCNEYGDVGLRRGGGRKRGPCKWLINY
jgi:hypothetical protein